jgi:16S rRNA (cytosine1402-N4)-methyltransferase
VHISVLPDEAMTWLNIRADGVYVDATAGAGGHTARVLAALKPEGRVIALDRDPSAVATVRERFSGSTQVNVLHANYGDLKEALTEVGVDAIDGLLIDAGVSSMQIDQGDRGFSFQEDGPLDMRMNTASGVTAAAWLATVSEADLAAVLKQYGDIRRAKTVARHILERRAECKLNTTRDLVDAVADAFPFVTGMPDETRQVFQAIRMAVNEELANLERGLKAGMDLLNPGGRLVAISFHSGEDRVIKNVLRDASRVERIRHPDGREKSSRPATMKILTAKPIIPGEAELRRNPRAHSAKLRAAEKRAV